MVFYNRNKNEMLVLTGAVYTFIAYMTAFTLEILFIIDLAKRNSVLFAATSSNPSATNNYIDGTQDITLDQASRLALESVQAHVTISCLAVSVLYFVIFVASLILIIALILRSTFFILIWMCVMTTMYLPEFGLVIYLSIYGWGLETRNGQTELIFYLFRSILNVIFICKAHKLFKEWNYEKNFFRLKTGSIFTGYDSPYFTGDSLTTTINPVFTSSTLNIRDRYDRIRDINDGSNSPAIQNTSASIIGSNNLNNKNVGGKNNNNKCIATISGNKMIGSDNYLDHDYDLSHIINSGPYDSSLGRNRCKSLLEDRYNSNNIPRYNHHRNTSFDDSSELETSTRTPTRSGFYSINSGDNHHQRRDCSGSTTGGSGGGDRLHQVQSVLSFNDANDLQDYEMDLEYRTLTHQQRNNHHQQQQYPSNHQNHGDNNHHQARRQLVGNNSQFVDADPRALNHSPRNLSYSTQSLDRRQMKDMDYNPPEQVILRPLAHQPFDYLHRPGSSSNLASINNLNTQPTAYTSTTRLAKRSNLNLYDKRYS